MAAEMPKGRAVGVAENAQFNRVHNWVQDKANAILINASRMDEEFDGIATGLSTAITRDGQTTVTADLPMAGFKHTGVGNASARDQYSSVAGLQDASHTFIAATGSAGAYSLTLSPAITAYVSGQTFTFKANHTTLVGIPTLVVSGLSAKDMYGALRILAGDIVTVVYDGTRFQVQSPRVASPTKGLFYNGAALVAQRGAITGQGASTAWSAVDGFRVRSEGSPQSRVDTSRDTTVPTSSGFKYSFRADCSIAEAAVGAGELLAHEILLEAQDLQHLMWGTSSAKPLTLSFWKRSPKTGAHCIAIYQPDANRSQVREFTVASADTFEFFTVTFPGDVSGVIDNNTGAGLIVSFPQLAGSDWHATANAWAGGQDYATSSQQSLLDSTNNDTFIVGFKPEVGAVATPFDHLKYGAVLFEAQRYTYAIDGDTVTNTPAGFGQALSTTAARIGVPIPRPMRDFPMLEGNATQWQLDDDANPTTALVSWAVNGAAGSPMCVRVTATVASGLTQYRPYWLTSVASGGNLILSAALTP